MDPDSGEKARFGVVTKPALAHEHPSPSPTGTRHFHPENTMPAFQAAVDLGFRCLETDLHVTADGVVVCFHDDTVVRTTNGRGRVAGMTFDQLRNLDAGYRFGARAVSRRGEGDRGPFARGTRYHLPRCGANSRPEGRDRAQRGPV